MSPRRTLHFTRLNNGKYHLDDKIVYWSLRYRKTCTIEPGFISDGASGPAEDIVSEAWWVHDKLCTTWKWDDGTSVTNWQASTVLHDILRSEGRWFRCWSWRLATWLTGYLWMWRRHGR